MKIRLKYFSMLALAGILAGCGNDEDPAQPDPRPNTSPNGSVVGSVSPANGASRVLLFAGQDTLKTTPNSTGVFSFADVKPGNYQVVARAYPGYLAPAPTAVTLEAGKVTEVPEIKMMALPINGLLAVTINGSPVNGTPIFSAVGNGSLSYSDGNLGFYLELPVISGPGTYTNANSDLNVIVIEGPSGARWETTKTLGTASLTVTSYDPVTLKGDATFSFTAPASANGATGSKTGTNGSLQNVRLYR